MVKPETGEVYCFGEHLIAHFCIKSAEKDYFFVVPDFHTTFTAKNATFKYNSTGDLSGARKVTGSLNHENSTICLNIGTGISVWGTFDEHLTGGSITFGPLDGKWVAG